MCSSSLSNPTHVVLVCGGGEVMMKGAQERMGNREAMSWAWMLKFPASGHPKNIS